jgi:ABC-type Fe3+/spermidine/putrescine transport system ATPase subunit
MIFQDLALWPHMKALGQVEFVLRNRGIPKGEVRSQAVEYLNRVNLNGHSKRYPHQLSGGEKQRLAIARALSSQPRYLLMDEPLSNLDPILKEEMLELIQQIKARSRMGVVYVTHDVREAVRICDRIAVINEGLIEQAGGHQAGARAAEKWAGFALAEALRILLTMKKACRPFP